MLDCLSRLCVGLHDAETASLPLFHFLVFSILQQCQP